MPWGAVAVLMLAVSLSWIALIALAYALLTAWMQGEWP